jgi:hypothetical protein
MPRPTRKVQVPCPCCLRLTPVETLEKKAEGARRLQAREVECIGGGRSGRPRGPGDKGRVKLTGEPGRGFRWHDPRDLTDDEIEVLARVAESAMRSVALLAPGSPTADLAAENVKLREMIKLLNTKVRQLESRRR